MEQPPRNLNNNATVICDCCNKSVIEPYISYSCPSIVKEFFACYCRDNKSIEFVIPINRPHLYILRTKSRACFYKRNHNIP